MRRIATDLPGVCIIEPRVFGDSRGFFYEALHVARYREAGIDFGPGAGELTPNAQTREAEAHGAGLYGEPSPVQLNHSRSVRGTLRGLHFQHPCDQGKLVWAVAGAVYDVAVDVRRGSPTFGRWTGVELTADNHLQIWVPPGFAHGFCVLSESADCMYACSDYYAPECEHTILWSDADIGIRWPITDPILSEKDARAPRLRDAVVLPSYRE